jgi:hypothetical protein
MVRKRIKNSIKRPGEYLGPRDQLRRRRTRTTMEINIDIVTCMGD